MSEEKKTNQNPNKLNIELVEEVAEGIYCNLSIISHMPTEFIFDFVRMTPGVPKAKVKSRIIMNPIQAKSLMRVLTNNIKKYEANFGTIKENQGSNLPPINFGEPPSKA